MYIKFQYFDLKKPNLFSIFVKKFYEHERPDLMVTGERYAYRMVAKEEETQKYIPTLNTDVSLISKQRKLILG